jgi:hypothetical protein
LSDSELERALALGGSGLWLDHNLFALEEIVDTLQRINAVLHSVQPAE